VKKRVLLAILVTYGLAACPVFSQGTLQPPGPPGPTMKTLTQVEPRIPLPGGTTNVTIRTGGSYYLTGNLQGKLTIAANNVSLDLMGFTILGATWNAIEQTGDPSNVRIHNGVVSAPNGSGIEFSVSSTNANGIIENLRVHGCGNFGIVIGSGYRIRDCQVTGSGIAGITAYGGSRVTGCTLTGNAIGLQFRGTGAHIADNVVKGNTANYDLVAGNQINLLLCEVPETLDWPCSATFAGTLVCAQTGTNCLTVNAAGVTIDLDGHALVGPGTASSNGIYAGYDGRDLTIVNGKIIGFLGTGTASGINIRGAGARVSAIQAATNGYGIVCGDGASVSDCVVRDSARDGIRLADGPSLRGCVAIRNGERGISVGSGATIDRCAAYGNGDIGIATSWGASIRGCEASENRKDGIRAYLCSTISECAAYRNREDGIGAGFNSFVHACTSSDNTGDGIEASSDAFVRGNTCVDNATGIHVIYSDNRIDGNNVTDNDLGIDVDESGNFIVRNTASGNTTNYSIAAGNNTGTIQSSPVGAGPWDNFEF